MRLKVWIRALRAPFFQAVLIPTILGAAVAWRRMREFHIGYFLLALLGVIFINAGTNLANDYFDHKSGADDINENFTPFSGGSRVIQEGLLAPRTILAASLVSFGLAILTGMFLVYTRGWILLVIGGIGIVSGYLYTATPLKLGYRGWGEFFAGLNCGPLVAMGAYYVQAQTLSWEVLVASIPVGFLAGTILYINQFSDYKTDKAANKANLVVKMGPARAVKGFYALLIAIYLSIVLGSALGVTPLTCLVSLLTLPLAWRVAMVAKANHAAEDARKMVPAMAGVIVMHLLIGLLLSAGYLTAGVLG